MPCCWGETPRRGKDSPTNPSPTTWSPFSSPVSRVKTSPSLAPPETHVIDTPPPRSRNHLRPALLRLLLLAQAPARLPEGARGGRYRHRPPEDHRRGSRQAALYQRRL